MLKLPRKTLLAIEAVADIAYNARPDPVQARDVTERQGIPQRYLEQVMQALVRAGVLKGVRGPRGGYTLARERRRITVGDVVRVVSTLDQEDGDEGVTSALGLGVVAPIWEEMQRELLDRLDRVTMEDLCREAQRKRVPRADEARPDFTI
ncbi:MAG: transcriptional regulator [Rhodobacteraceae bacterium]|nr:transcriptional regulator [Paracoccaceae bacterium]